MRNTKSDKSNSYTNDQYFEADKASMVNGLYNTMLWYNKYKDDQTRVIDMDNGSRLFHRKMLRPVPHIRCHKQQQRYRRQQKAPAGDSGLSIPETRDLNRNGVLDPEEIRWFVPAIDQYTYCFLDGRSGVRQSAIRKAYRRGIPRH